MEPESVMTDKMQEEFEKWASGKGLILRKATSGKQFYYLFEDTDYAWEAWQAARTVPEGYVMVPVDLLDRFPELNELNYSHDGVCELNAWGIDLVLSAAPEPKK